jgi:D-sedoheptulose 7-phosphate isomerase
VILEALERYGRMPVRAEVTDAEARRLALDVGLERAVELLVQRTAARAKVMFIGNGASAAIASHQALDFWKNGGMRATAFNDLALLTAVSNDHGYPEVFERPIDMFADPGDVLIAISSSGGSENILRGVAAGVRRGCRVITFSGLRPDNPLRARGELNFFVPSMEYGPVEVAHLALSHVLLDTIIARRPAGR